MDISHISVSRKKTYEECSAKYKFKYHLKVPEPGPEPFYFIYGTIVHKIAELYVINKGSIQIGELAKDVVRGKYEIEDGVVCPPIPDDYKRKFQKHLRAIQNLTERIGSEGQVEKNFRYDLDPPNDRCVTGFIDRLILKGDKAFIIDYKTTKKGKWRVNRETVKDDLQLRCYSRVVQREYNLPAENIKAALYYLEGEELIGCQYSEQSLLQVEKDLLEAFIEIERADPDKVWGRVGWHCKNCPYMTLCPFYKPQSEEQASWSGSLEDLGHDPWA
jgi:CRISPR/Cas system-associated exonuclease Cas4 (RecB family)